jgi:hypothetical protein
VKEKVSDLVKIVAILCLTALGITAAFAFPETASKVTFGSIIAVIAAVVGVPGLVAWLRSRR